MLNLTKLGLLLIIAGAAAAQTDGAKAEPKSTRVDTKYFPMEFTMKEVENGRVVNSRVYAMTASGAGSSRIRTGSKLPVPTSSGGSNYVDVGVNVDCGPVSEVDGYASFALGAEVSSVGSDVAVSGAPPVIRQNRWDSRVIVPLRKPTVVFSSDDLGSKRQMQLEVTATPIP
jgi:hypothetical protein